jgi:hypothetical protein
LQPHIFPGLFFPFFALISSEALSFHLSQREERKLTDMACALTASTTGKEDFTGKIGTGFTVDMTSPAGSGLVIVSMSYNGKTVTAAPFTFNVGANTNFFFVHFEALVPGAKLQVVENCGDSRQVLETVFFDPSNPGTGYEITGV